MVKTTMAAILWAKSENSQYYKAGLIYIWDKLNTKSGEKVTLQSIMEAVYTHLEQETQR